ncbi:hypothetical protein [Kitasatospora sp. GP82]|uniref:hypothetical protein n=1 Tax=Kitasatospora sp. GP82 TaxID=3035089 RepID=UPI002473FD8C|nr:hypothetical protein [Kitasatospora sp. GP82]MDH6123602.1 hypothetical protein [Kitasatospora sp. GP82]
MAKSLNPEDITVTQSAGETFAFHDASTGPHDDNDTNDSGGGDAAAWMRSGHRGRGGDDTD